MPKQDYSSMPLFSWNQEDTTSQKQTATSKSLILFCWNIANPSLKRAEIQAPWLQQQYADVLILTECKNSKGCQFLEKYFRAYGYDVVFPRPEGNEYGVLIASKYKIEPTRFLNDIDYLSSRVVSVLLKHPSFPNDIEIIGVYIPSRDRSYEKIERKKRFINNLLNVLDGYSSYSYRIFCGDFNVLEPNHVPRYNSIFQDWEYNFYSKLTDYNLQDAFRYLHPKDQEYSWVGRTGDGYRYDHCFVSVDLLPLIHSCYYLHKPREEKLSDHSALITDMILQSS